MKVTRYCPDEWVVRVMHDVQRATKRGDMYVLPDDYFAEVLIYIHFEVYTCGDGELRNMAYSSARPGELTGLFRAQGGCGAD